MSNNLKGYSVSGTIPVNIPMSHGVYTDKTYVTDIKLEWRDGTSYAFIELHGIDNALKKASITGMKELKELIEEFFENIDVYRVVKTK